ncbi:MAG: peptide chain release factor N(5)-glutamine methyltransferase, partial [Rhodospirillales bacterium]
KSRARRGRDREGGSSTDELLRAASNKLTAAGVENPRRDARILLAAALGIESNASLPEGAVTPSAARRFRAMIVRRARREPVSRILGKRDFWTLTLRLNPATLDPRPDSETVVETVLARLGDRGRAWRILDLGTGTGCLLLALLSELPNATGLGVDIAPRALAAARANAREAGLAGRARFAAGDWGEGLRGSFDVIVANPPYIPRSELPRLEPEVRRFDPALALDGGRDGLDAYRAILGGIARLLARHALVAFELGQGQVRAVARLLKAQGLQILETKRDLAGIDRCIIATGGQNRHSRESAR